MAVGQQYIPCMSCSRDSESFNDLLNRFSPNRYPVTRSLALFSAAITVADTRMVRRSIRVGLDHGANRTQLYETMLQSYLFLGFPRMLTAAECLSDEIPPAGVSRSGVPVSPDEVALWLDRGRQLCRKVYNSNYEGLKNRVENVAPEVFHWMELEGYGKVLSRPGLDIVDRELAIVACLMLENRVAQLYSHLKGALNVGASSQLLIDVVTDLQPAASDGYQSAREILEKLGVS